MYGIIIASTATVFVLMICTKSTTSDFIQKNTTEGLYDGFKQIVKLNKFNFSKTIFEEEKQKLWLVEFYKHWCGHCQRKVPLMKALAVDIYEWRDTVVIGAIDCADELNTELCRDMGVPKAPTLRIFLPNSPKESVGLQFVKQEHTGSIESIMGNITKDLKEYQNNQSEIYGVVNLKLLAQSDLEKIWGKFPQIVIFLVLVFEPKYSLIGSQLALDVSRTSVVRVRLVDPDNKHLAQLVGWEEGKTGAVIIRRDSDHSEPTLITTKPYLVIITDYTREQLNKAVRQYLISNGVKIDPDIPHANISQFGNGTEPKCKEKDMEWDKRIEKALNVSSLSTIVFLMDLEAAVNGIFTTEVAQMGVIEGQLLEALKDFMETLVNYFPSGQRIKIFFKELKEELLNQNHLKGEFVSSTFKELENKYKPFMPNLEWVGCHGTAERFRGYPCSLWVLFHTLVAQEELHDRIIPDSKPKALNAIASYIKYFFSCRKCAKNFDEMAKTIAGNVTTPQDAVIWLWKAHNDVNHRLAGDTTQDPCHPKVQFPTKDACPTCSSCDGSWDESEIFTFLSDKFTNIVPLDPHQIKERLVK